MTTRQQWAIGIIVMIALAFIPIGYEYVNSLPSPKLDVKIYDWSVNTTQNEDNTTYVGLNTTFPSYLTNTGNVPINIVVCDVYLSQNGKPTNLSEERISEIAYLKPQDNFAYNFTKYFNVSIPEKSPEAFDNIYNHYLLVVGYYTQNLNDVKWIWISPPAYVFS